VKPGLAHVDIDGSVGVVESETRSLDRNKALTYGGSLKSRYFPSQPCLVCTDTGVMGSCLSVVAIDGLLGLPHFRVMAVFRSLYFAVVFACRCVVSVDCLPLAGFFLADQILELGGGQMTSHEDKSIEGQHRIDLNGAYN
jgi:hypothetical protein